MGVVWVEAYREFGGAEPSWPSIVGHRAELDAALGHAVARYLRRAPLLAAVGGVAERDVFTGADRVVAPIDIMTDGVFVWWGQLAYYVKRHGVGVPADLLAHIRARDFAPPRLTRAQLVAIEAEVFGAEDARE